MMMRMAMAMMMIDDDQDGSNHLFNPDIGGQDLSSHIHPNHLKFVIDIHTNYQRIIRQRRIHCILYSTVVL